MKIEIISGEGEQGTVERYTGERTPDAIKSRLTEERAGGDRWAILHIDDCRIDDDEIQEFFDWRI